MVISSGIQDFKNYGASAFTLYLMNRLMQSVSRSSVEHFHLFYLPGAAQEKILIPAALSKPYKLEIYEEYHPDLEAFGTSRSTLDFRFGQNAICFLLRKGEMTPVGFFWMASGVFREDVVWCDFHLPADAMWDFDLVVAPEYRFSPAFSILWRAALDWIKARGMSGVYSRIGAMNRNSLDLHTRMGGHVVGSYVFFKFKNNQVFWDGLERSFSKCKPDRRKIVKLSSPGMHGQSVGKVERKS